jgi:hypothetical protein
MTCTRTTTLAILSALIAVGCPASDDGTGDTTGSTAPATMGTTAPGSGDDGSADDDSADATTDATPPATSNATGGGPMTGDDAGDDGGQCELDAMDDECATCVKTTCCAQLEACEQDAGCTCFQDCVEMNPGAQGAVACGGECDVVIFGEGVTAELVGCSSMPPCAEPCGV